MNNNQKPFPKKVSIFLWEYSKIFKKQMFILFLFVLTVTALLNLNNWFFAQIVESVKENASGDSIQKSLIYILLMFVFGIVAIFINRMNNVYTEESFRIPLIAKLNKDLFAYLQGHSYDYIISRQTGTFVQKITQIKQIRTILYTLINNIWKPITDVLVKAILLLIISPILSGLFVLCVLIILMTTKTGNKIVKKASKLSAFASSLVNGRVTDAISNIKLVKQFNNLKFEQDRLKPLFKQEYDMIGKQLDTLFKQYTFSGLLISSLSILMIIASVYLWQKSFINMGDIVFVLLTVNSGLLRLNDLNFSMELIEADIGTIENGLEPFSEVHQIQDDIQAKNLKNVSGEINFEQVDFAYNKNKPVFSGFNLTIHPNEKVGIVGTSGSGKTTLINLLQRFYDIQGGKISIDGKDISKITQESLHNTISAIPQESSLFHRSICENIAYGKPQASQKAIISASKKAYADEFILEKEDAYETVVGDRGCQLSGGEKQRIAIARAILKDAPIVILDEATSALDSETEELISLAMKELLQGKTVLAIAHRLSTLKAMDRIIVLENGKIVEQGPPDILLNQGGKFAELWKMQSLKRRKNV